MTKSIFDQLAEALEAFTPEPPKDKSAQFGNGDNASADYLRRQALDEEARKWLEQHPNP